MKNLHIWLVVLSMSLVFSGCEKDNDPPSKSEIIAGKDWKIKTYFVSENNGTPYDVFASPNVSECTKDDIYKFSSDGKYMIDEGVTKCNQQDSQIYEEGTWVISEDILKRTYPVTNGDFTETYTIIELTQTQMVLERTITEQGRSYKLTITYLIN